MNVRGKKNTNVSHHMYGGITYNKLSFWMWF